MNPAILRKSMLGISARGSDAAKTAQDCVLAAQLEECPAEIEVVELCRMFGIQ